jgi:hypothetical protein
VFVNQGFQFLKLFLRLLLVQYRMARHGHIHDFASCFHAGVDLLQGLRRTDGFFCTTLQTILKPKEWLSDGVGEADSRAVYKRDFPHTPAQQVSRDVAAQSAGPKKKA